MKSKLVSHCSKSSKGIRTGPKGMLLPSWQHLMLSNESEFGYSEHSDYALMRSVERWSCEVCRGGLMISPLTELRIFFCEHWPYGQPVFELIGRYLPPLFAWLVMRRLSGLLTKCFRFLSQDIAPLCIHTKNLTNLNLLCIGVISCQTN